MSVKVHIGKEIQKEVEHQNLSVAEFARRINKTRPSVYHIYKSQSIDSELLLTVSEVLKVNFFTYYVSSLSKEIGSASDKDKKAIEELKKELELKNKLISLLEEKAQKNN